MKTDTPLAKWFVFCIVAVGIFMSTLDGSIVNIALPTILTDFGAPLSTIKWIPVIYLLTITCLLMAFGRLSDMVGRRKVYVRGLLVFSAGSLCCGISGSAFWLIASRSFQGVGAAMIMACTPALIVDNFPAKERGKAMGMIGAVVATGLTAGPPMGGIIVEHWSWPWIFFINVPVGLAAAAAASRILTRAESRDAGERFDWPGAVLLALCFGGLIAALSLGREWGWSSPLILGLFGAFIVSAPLLTLAERRVRHPLVDPSLFRIRYFALALAAAVTLFISLFAVIFLMPFYLTHPGGFSNAQAGGILVTPFIFLLAGAPVFGALSDRMDARILCAGGMSVVACALFSFALMPPVTTFGPLFWRLALTGFGTAMFTAPNNASSLNSVPANRRGIASALVATARNLGMVVGIALAGGVFSAVFEVAYPGLTLDAYEPSMAAGFMEAFHQAMLWAGGAAVLGAVLSALRGGPPRRGA